MHRPTPDEAREALDSAIAETGFTREELEVQAVAGRFETALAHQDVVLFAAATELRLSSSRSASARVR